MKGHVDSLSVRTHLNRLVLNLGRAIETHKHLIGQSPEAGLKTLRIFPHYIQCRHKELGNTQAAMGVASRRRRRRNIVVLCFSCQRL